ncbi:MAG: hypothetical protein CM15mP65_06040 [Crocinitomicaceae bacterium]|nr:MAG: hypothetical protein CM15mP65_06040 [Crocinitomicaceae bacterium]
MGFHISLEIDHERAMKALVDYKVGSVLNTINNTAQTPETWYGAISTYSTMPWIAIDLKSHNLWIDAIHGTTYTDGATMFPQQITTAASGILKMHITWLWLVLMKLGRLLFHGIFLQY